MIVQRCSKIAVVVLVDVGITLICQTCRCGELVSQLLFLGAATKLLFDRRVSMCFELAPY
jgi:hypothetical protein